MGARRHPVASSASHGASVGYEVVEMHRGSRWGAVTGVSAAWSPLARTRFVTDNIQVAHDLIARMYANKTLQACGGNGSYSRRYRVLPSHTLRR